MSSSSFDRPDTIAKVMHYDEINWTEVSTKVKSIPKTIGTDYKIALNPLPVWVMFKSPVTELHLTRQCIYLQMPSLTESFIVQKSIIQPPQNTSEHTANMKPWLHRQQDSISLTSANLRSLLMKDHSNSCWLVGTNTLSFLSMKIW